MRATVISIFCITTSLLVFHILSHIVNILSLSPISISLAFFNSHCTDWLAPFCLLPLKCTNFSRFNAYTVYESKHIDSSPTKKKIKMKMNINKLCKYRTTERVIHFRHIIAFRRVRRTYIYFNYIYFNRILKQHRMISIMLIDCS